MSLTIRSIDRQLAILVEPFNEQVNLVFSKAGDHWSWVLDKNATARFVEKSVQACRGDRAMWISDHGFDPDQILIIKMVRRGDIFIDVYSVDDDDLFQVEDVQFSVADWESLTGRVRALTTT